MERLPRKVESALLILALGFGFVVAMVLPQLIGYPPFATVAVGIIWLMIAAMLVVVFGVAYYACYFAVHTGRRSRSKTGVAVGVLGFVLVTAVAVALVKYEWFPDSSGGPRPVRLEGSETFDEYYERIRAEKEQEDKEREERIYHESLARKRKPDKPEPPSPEQIHVESLRLRNEAESYAAKYQELLAPFFARTPLTQKRFSYSKLKEAGALKNTNAGWLALVRFVEEDRTRPSWGLRNKLTKVDKIQKKRIVGANSSYWNEVFDVFSMEEIEQVEKAQSLLRNYGRDWVDLAYLAP